MIGGRTVCKKSMLRSTDSTRKMTPCHVRMLTLKAVKNFSLEFNINRELQEGDRLNQNLFALENVSVCKHSRS